MKTIDKIHVKFDDETEIYRIIESRSRMIIETKLLPGDMNTRSLRNHVARVFLRASEAYDEIFNKNISALKSAYENSTNIDENRFRGIVSEVTGKWVRKTNFVGINTIFDSVTNAIRDSIDQEMVLDDILKTLDRIDDTMGDDDE